jgi:hypothetical protein
MWKNRKRVGRRWRRCGWYPGLGGGGAIDPEEVGAPGGAHGCAHDAVEAVVLLLLRRSELVQYRPRQVDLAPPARRPAHAPPHTYKCE